MTDDIKDLVAQVNIVDVIGNFSPLTKAGASYKTLCNVHGDRSPSLSINPRKQIYKCFVCNHGGNALDYLIWAQQYTFPAAVKYLATQAGVSLEQYLTTPPPRRYSAKEQELLNCLTDAWNLFRYYLDLYHQTPAVAQFLQQRHLSSDELVKYGLGYAPAPTEEDYLPLLTKKQHSLATLINASLRSEAAGKPVLAHRLIFPILDEDGQVVAFSGRSLDPHQSPKYFHSKESLVFHKGTIIYNYHNAKRFETLIVVEGFMDVIALGKLGYDNAVALMGTSLTREQLQKLNRHKFVYLCLDQDHAGQQATIAIIAQLLQHQIAGAVVLNPHTKDVDELVNRPGGPEHLRAIMAAPVAFIDFVYKHLQTMHDLRKPEGIRSLITTLRRFVPWLDPIAREKFLAKLAQDVELELALIKKELAPEPNVIKFEKYNLNGQRKQGAPGVQNLQEEQELVNINKLLLTLFANPSYLQFNYINDIDWFLPKYWKMYQEILAYHQRQVLPSATTKTHLVRLKEKYCNAWVLPRTEAELQELIARAAADDRITHLNQLGTQLISSSASEQAQIDVLETKQNEMAKKID